MFDYDDSINLAFDAKIAGKKLVTAKHELLTKTGEFLFLAHSERELALRMQMVEEDLEKVAYRKLSNVSDSKAKLARAIFDEWQLRHASCSMCKTAAGEWSSMGRANGEGMVCNGGGNSGVLGVYSCGAKNPPGGLGHNTGLCIKCEDKLGMKVPPHDYTGQTFNDSTTASKELHPDWNPDSPHAVPKEPSKWIKGDPKWNPNEHNPDPTLKPTPHPDWNPDSPHAVPKEPSKWIKGNPDWNPDPNRKSTPNWPEPLTPHRIQGPDKNKELHPYNPDPNSTKEPKWIDAYKKADNNQVTPGSMGSNAVNGFCHGCGSFLGDMAMGALLASKKTATEYYDPREIKYTPAGFPISPNVVDRKCGRCLAPISKNFPLMQDRPYNELCIDCYRDLTKKNDRNASKKTAHDHSVFCNSCQSDPSQIGCTSCKDSLSR